MASLCRKGYLRAVPGTRPQQWEHSKLSPKVAQQRERKAAQEAKAEAARMEREHRRFERMIVADVEEALPDGWRTWPVPDQLVAVLELFTSHGYQGSASPEGVLLKAEELRQGQSWREWIRGVTPTA